MKELYQAFLQDFTNEDLPDSISFDLGEGGERGQGSCARQGRRGFILLIDHDTITEDFVALRCPDSVREIMMRFQETPYVAAGNFVVSAYQAYGASLELIRCAAVDSFARFEEIFGNEEEKKRRKEND